MPSIPKDPREFFGSWLSASFEPLLRKLPRANSPGAVVFYVGERAPLAVRLTEGALSTSEGLPADAIVQVTLGEADFEPILVRGAERLA